MRAQNSEATSSSSLISPDMPSQERAPKISRLEGVPSHETTPQIPRLEVPVIDGDSSSLVPDPGLRRQIYEYHVDQRYGIRRDYLIFGSYQPKLDSYPLTGTEKYHRHFIYNWFTQFPWLEYSPSKNKTFCHPCFIFNKNTNDCFGSHVFSVGGFQNWKKIHDGINCAFLTHIGRDPNSTHNISVRACQDLMRQSQNIERVFQRQTSQQIADDRLKLKTSIDSTQWLTYQRCSFRAHDEKPDTINHGNFIEMVKLITSYNGDVANVVLEKAKKNCKYISPQIQKETLNILASKVRHAIHEEIGESKFCIIVDEARDESKKEQMALVLRVLSHFNLSDSNIRGKGYDGASNMRGEWNGLQALILKDCPYAYFVHCLAHRLQLTLVAAAKKVKPVYHFFTKLLSVVNIVGASCKRHDELQIAQENKIEELLAIGEIESGSGLNQIGTLQRPADTRWSSHFTSVCSLINMFDATCIVLTKIMEDGCTYSSRGDVDTTYNAMTFFEFIFILHLTRDIMGITDDLCQALQSQSQDILNALQLMKTMKFLIQELRDSGWSTLLENVICFCNQHDIDVPDMSSNYVVGRGRKKQDHITIEHHYRVDIFYTAVDSQLQELNIRSNEHTLELFLLSSALDPRDGYKSFKVNDICTLVEKFYPQDFSSQENIHLRYQLQHYILDVNQCVELQDKATIVELCEGL